MFKNVALLISGIAIGWFLATKSQSRAIIESPTKISNTEAKSKESLEPGTTVIPKSNIANKPASNNTEPRNLKIIKDEFDSALNSDNLREAQEFLDEMEKAGQNSKEFLEGKSRFLVRTRENEKAKEVLDRCLQFFPESKSCLIDNASVVLGIGDKEEQEKAILACLQRFPKDMQCRNMLAILRMNQGKYPTAVSIYEELMRDNGSYGVRFPEWLLDNQMGTALEGSGRLSEAITYFDRSCRSGQNENACGQVNQIRARL